MNRSLFALIGAALFAPSVAMSVTLDNFSVDQEAFDAPFELGGNITTVSDPSLAGDRTFEVEAGPPSAGLAETALTSGGDSDILRFSNQSLIGGSGSVSYSLGGVDIASLGGSFVIDLLDFDLNDALAEFTIIVDGIGSSIDIGDEDIGRLSIPFSAFGAADLSNVMTLGFTIDAANAPSLDADFDNFGVAPVPLPAAGFLLVAAVGALGAVKRRRS